MIMVTYAEYLDLAACLVVLFALWIRRATWRYRWEQPKTIGLTLMAIGTLLKAPPISWLIDRDVLHDLYLLVAHIFIVSGIAAFAYSAERKLRSDMEIRRWHVKFVVAPWAIGIVTMVSLFATGAWTTLDHPTGLPAYTVAYWVAYDLLVVYFLVLFAYALGYLLYDPPSRCTVGFYLVAVAVGLVGAACRALMVTVDDNVADPALSNIANTTNGLAIMGFALCSAFMWRRQLRALNSRKDDPSQPSVRNIT